MHDEIIFAGFGGQGILFMSRLIAYTGMLEGLEVTWMPSYGAEVRGGTAHAMVILSQDTIASPLVKEPLSALVMNGPSLRKFAAKVKPGGLLLINSSLCDSETPAVRCESVGIPATEMAAALGDIRVANMIMLGAYLAKRKIVSFDEVRKALEVLLQRKPEFLSLNFNALEKGRQFAQAAVTA